MPTTGAVVFLKLRNEAAGGSARSTGNVVFIGMRTTTGQFAARGVATTTNLRNLRAMLPSRSEPVMDESGMMSHGWWNWFSFINGVFLTARSNPTLSDVIAAITSIQGNASTTESSIAALIQQGAANAQAIQALTQVVQSAALPGATQVPVAQLAVQVTPSGAAINPSVGAAGAGGGD